MIGLHYYQRLLIVFAIIIANDEQLNAAQTFYFLCLLVAMQPLVNK